MWMPSALVFDTRLQASDKILRTAYENTCTNEALDGVVDGSNALSGEEND